MIQQTITGIMVASLLIGCGGNGGSSSSKDKMSEKDGIIIIYNVPEKDCLSKKFFREMQVLLIYWYSHGESRRRQQYR